MAEHCETHGISHYLPLREETRIYQRRKVNVLKPVFQGYFFCAPDEEGRIKLINTNHILRFLNPTSTREFLRQLVQVRRALAVDPGLSSRKALRRGLRVRILQGPFMGIEGMVSIIKGTTTVCLNVQMIGQAISVEVDQNFIEQL